MKNIVPRFLHSDCSLYNVLDLKGFRIVFICGGGEVE
jgi:hypothetical protein